MTIQPLQATDDQEKAAADARLATARALLQKESADPALLHFFDALFAGASAEDIIAGTPEALGLLARESWTVAAKHRPGAVTVELLARPSVSVLVAVNDDRPFLYDSALQAAIAAGARIRAAFHPIIPLGSSQTSVIVLVLDTVPGETAQTALLESMRGCFQEGKLAVRDWQAMLARLKAARAELAAHPPKDRDIAEDLAFLDWLGDNHFTFLGARDYRLAADGDHGRLNAVADSGLGALSDDDARVLRRGLDRPPLNGAVRAFLDEPEPLIVTKSISRSQVHRRVHMDYVGVKIFNADGVFEGEHRFVGLFTSGAYSLSPRSIPLLRRKIAAVSARAGLAPASHDGKALAHILDTFPRDELFQISDNELFDTAMGILRLGGRPKVKLFLRFDRFDRFVSALLFAPRDHITQDIRERIHALLAKALNGRASAATPAIDESALVQIHYIIGRNEGPRPKVDIRALEQDIVEIIKTWDDSLLEALAARHGRADGARLLAARAPRFSPGYRGSFPAHEAARDLEALEALAKSDDALKIRAQAYRRPGDAHSALRLKLYVLGEVLPLSASLPVFENLGLKVIAEDAFPVSFTRDDAWREDGVILDFLMERADGQDANLDAIRGPLEDVFHAVLRGAAESDGFNRLVIGAGIAWRDAVILRMAAKYLRQAAIAFSQDYMEQALARNPDIAALLAALFHARLDPKSANSDEEKKLSQAIETSLGNVPSLDDDRIIRRLRNVIESILRTNYYQPEKPCIAIKLDSQKLDELPAPRPWREIFVYSPEIEGVHLRFGRIARGGIRWSDRREDFRTEILGLVKAQQVKNAVIVPVGAKGGFFPKAMPVNPTREQMQAVGIAAYKTLINALLDVTDNLAADGSVMPPPDVLRHDGDDPYLVVAADKGTATFSDIANAIALERGFWLGDAFASGGSVGYDHKKMGITARGAWEAVKRHFRELGRDIQKEDFTVVGVGDMSGDVFGNGMLLSRHIRLAAAFDHRHIFLDPNGDAGAAFKERERLFALPRSSWDDYNKALIGKGGGVFARTLKEIPLSSEVQALIGSDKASLAPAALINALLKAQVDLLWFGGIGTYIKAASQSNLDVGDRANDAVRVNGGEVRAKVVGEGANLGATQLGRIEYAKAGGRIDTDAIDNSAGVDTSDHEVNLKILLGGPVGRGELSEAQRNDFLATLTDDVAAHVLADNYNQTLALSVAEARSARDGDAYGRFIRDLESRSKLDRAVEFLPTDTALSSLAHDNKGLTRPELCVLLAYAKLDLDTDVLASGLPDDPALTPLLTGYFPPPAVARFPQEPGRHRLKREIVSTVLVNALVNLAGPLFAFRMREVSGLSGADVARGFVLAEGAFGLGALKARVDALDGMVAAAVQTRLYSEIAEQLRRVTPWFLNHVAADASIADTLALYRVGVDVMRQVSQSGEEERARTTEWTGVPADLARDIALLPILAAAPDIALLAHKTQTPAAKVAALYAELGSRLGLDRLRSLAAKLSPPDHWDRLALRRLLDDLSLAQSNIARTLLADGGDITAWAKSHGEALERTRAFLTALEGSGELSVAKLMLANSQVQNLN